MPVQNDTNNHRKSSNLTLPPFDSILESYYSYTDAKRENTPPPKKIGLTGESMRTLAGRGPTPASTQQNDQKRPRHLRRREPSLPAREDTDRGKLD